MIGLPNYDDEVMEESLHGSKVFKRYWYEYFDRLRRVAWASTAHGILLSVPGVLAVGTNVAPLYSVDASHGSISFLRFDLLVKQAPVGSDLIVEVFSDATSLGVFTVPDGSTSGGGPVTLPAPHGSLITVNINQVGSGTAGSDLSVIGRL